VIKWLLNFPGIHFTGCCRLFAVVFSCLLMISCGGEDPRDIIDDFLQTPDTETIRATIRTAVPLAHIAAVAMEAVNGNPSGEVTSYTTCASYPCLSLVSMELDQNNLPFTFDTSGSVGVTGLWTSEDSAILTVFFYDVYAGIPAFRVSEISTFPVERVIDPEGGYRYILVFSEIDINIDTDSEPDELSEEERQAEYDRLDIEPSDDAEVNIALDAWMVEVLDADTPGDYTDDSYTISGGGEYIGVVSGATSSSASVMQLGLALVQISHDCSSNPTEGFAFINEVSVSANDPGSLPVVASALMAFDSTCDGTVQVMVATGNYVGSIGSSIPMDLNQ